MQKLRQGEESKDKRALDEFLVGNRELEKLTAILNKFNIFQVLRIEHNEIRHSNVIAWLLNPKESHGLSEIFIKRFLSNILLSNQKHDSKLSPAKAELMNLGDVEVFRELGSKDLSIDLLIYSKENEFVVLIENKIRANESKGQLRKYFDFVKENFKEAKSVISVLLTTEGELPSEEARELGYIPWNHRALSDITTGIIEEQHDRIPQDAQIFLQHYLDVLRRETMQDEELVKLCKSIYKKHKDAIKLIKEYGISSEFEQAGEDFIKEQSDLRQYSKNARSIWFVPEKWKQTMPDKIIDNWGSPYPVALWFEYYKEKLSFHIEIGPMLDKNKRSKLVQSFIDAGFKSKMAGKKAMYTRVYGCSRHVDELADNDKFKKTMLEIWKDAKDEIKKATKVIINFDWNAK